ncbi:hypothetical protein [Diplocloster agilis]|uniref:Uncharacterized protein n=1 Tax=Diplocloster agilis TaxID=2850323 RepID=A0A949JVR8_9FIRM|nr:hypothetical protein [Diplocloster agilis]MBU9735539.1 hypothetical protein [Diplocloster agilis]
MGDFIIIYMKRLYHILKRNKIHKSKKIICTKKQLLEKHIYYEDYVASIYNEIVNYQNSINNELNEPSIYFTGYSILSYNGDRMGKVLGRDGKIYRGIYPESVPSFRKLWSTGLLQILGEHNLIPRTIITDYFSDEYPIILEHQTVDISVSSLWNTEMIKDAAILICLIKQIAQRVGFTLHDGHINNVSFEKGQPIFTDIGSIVEDQGQATICDREILFTAIYRLIFHFLGNSLLKHIQLYDETNNAIWVSPRFYDDLVREYVHALNVYERYHLFHSSWQCNRIIYRMFRRYEVLPEYIDCLFPMISEKEKEFDDSIYMDIEVLGDELEKADITFHSIVDVGGNSGKLVRVFYSKFKCRTIALENDDTESGIIYKHCVKDNIPINTFVFHYLYGASDEKLKSIRGDIAVCLDLTHSNVAYQRFKADSLFNSLCKLSNRYVAISYYPNKEKVLKYDPYLRKDGTEDIGMFENVFRSFFDIVIRKEIGDRNSRNFRILYVGRKNG